MSQMYTQVLQVLRVILIHTEIVFPTTCCSHADEISVIHICRLREQVILTEGG